MQNILEGDSLEGASLANRKMLASVRREVYRAFCSEWLSLPVVGDICANEP